MLKKTAALAALALAATLGTTSALADGGWRDAGRHDGGRYYGHGYGHDRSHYGYGHRRVHPRHGHRHTPYYGPRHVVVHRPVMVRHVAPPRPVVVYRQHGGHEVLGGLILGAVLGAVIASHGGY